MATYQQYSEVVAAYGYTLPPPAQPQAGRIWLGLLYAAIGVALGTTTGAGMAAVSLQPGGASAWARHLSLPRITSAMTSAHQVVQATSAPVPAVAHVAPAPAPKAVQAMSVPAQAPAAAKAAPAVAAAPAPAVQPSLMSKLMPSSVVEASVDTKAVAHMLAVHHEAVRPRAAIAPAVPHHEAAVQLASVGNAAAPAVKLAAVHMPSVSPVPSVVPVSLDDEVKPAIFYSEGDTTVVDYDSTLDSIVTSDGRTFVIGPTVAMSSAASWNDYRDNVHYRCDQGGKCTITRSGVIALSAKLI